MNQTWEMWFQTLFFLRVSCTTLPIFLGFAPCQSGSAPSTHLLGENLVFLCVHGSPNREDGCRSVLALASLSPFGAGLQLCRGEHGALRLLSARPLFQYSKIHTWHSAGHPASRHRVGVSFGFHFSVYPEAQVCKIQYQKSPGMLRKTAVRVPSEPWPGCPLARERD